MKQVDAYVGMRVKLVESILISTGIQRLHIGTEGVIRRIATNGNSAAVEFNQPLHDYVNDCHGSCKPGYGKYIEWDLIEPVPERVNILGRITNNEGYFQKSKNFSMDPYIIYPLGIELKGLQDERWKKATEKQHLKMIETMLPSKYLVDKDHPIVKQICNIQIKRENNLLLAYATLSK